MDVMKMSLSTNFMKGVLAKLLSRHIKKKYGYKIDIRFNEIDFDMIGGQTHLHLNVDAKLNDEEFKKLMKDISENES